MSRNIFTVRTQSFEPIRKALQVRGWIEKVIPAKADNEECEKIAVLADHTEPKTRFRLPRIKRGQTTENYIKQCENLILQRILRKFTPNLYWIVSREDRKSISFLPEDILINRISKPLAISKEKLYHCLRNLQWHCESNVSYTRYPRCYLTANKDYLSEFTNDYRTTACISLLRAFIKNFKKRESIHTFRSPQGILSPSIIQFAINRCRDYIQVQNHKDIDEKETEIIQHGAWERFLKNYYAFVHQKTKTVDTNEVEYKALYNKSKDVLDLMMIYWSQYDIDGINNVWIIKPGCKSMGRGIIILYNFYEIVDALTPKPGNTNKYVIQKYVERPLLIYDTKFDIRQWFLVTSVIPLEIWMYRKCYLRFSSRKYTLNNFHEVIHLTNNSVQRRYQESPRVSQLPSYNMWSSDQFILYLEETIRPNIWHSTVYLKMKEAIIGAMLVCQENFDSRINSFELFGADFILTNDYVPWLLEINGGPDMSSTTPVTALLCPQCLEDVIKVVVDRQKKPDAPTGYFELIYRQSEARCPSRSEKEALTVKGKHILLKPYERKRCNTPNNIDIKTEICRPISEGEHSRKTEEILKKLQTPITTRKTWRNVTKKTSKAQSIKLKTETNCRSADRKSRNDSKKNEKSGFIGRKIQTKTHRSLNNIRSDTSSTSSMVAKINTLRKMLE